ncbi:MAG: efflux RND transporter periplasmic adaptor subunit [Tepidisphaeraceae bacterium]
MNPKISQAILAVVIAGSTLAHAAPGHDHDHDHAAEAKHDHAPATQAAHDDHDDHAAGGHADEVKLTEVAIKQNNVRIGVAEARNLRASFVAPARLCYDAEAMAHVSSVVSGRVIELKAKLGDKVNKDDELLVVESPDFGRAQSEYLQRRTEADTAAAAVAAPKDAFARAEKLYDESQGVAYSEVQKREGDYRAAVGAAANAKASLQAAENGLHLFGLDNAAVKKLAETGEINARFSIRAAIAGQVIAREVTLGELVSPDKEKLLVIANTERLWVQADVPEGRLADVGVGSAAEVQIASLPGERVKGEVSLVSPEIDPATRTARLRIVIANADGKLRPGMFAKALIQSRDANNGQASVVVPEEAVQAVEGKPSVFVPVADEPNTFARREVVVGRTVNGFVPVISGLQADEKLVVSGSFILKAELGKSEAGHEH